jgi:hypothetical protein
MNKQILVAFTILIFALAIIGYAYSTWLKKINIQGAVNVAEFAIYIQDHNVTQTWQMSPDNHTLELGDFISLGGTIWTGIIIKNNSTTPVTITYLITTNDTEAEKWFLSQTHFYGPYQETEDISAVWDKATAMPPSSDSPTPPELPAKNKLVAWQNITLDNNCPSDAFTTIEITVAYTGTFQTWTDTVYVKYTLTLQPSP